MVSTSVNYYISHYSLKKTGSPVHQEKCLLPQQQSPGLALASSNRSSHSRVLINSLTSLTNDSTCVAQNKNNNVANLNICAPVLCFDVDCLSEVPSGESRLIVLSMQCAFAFEPTLSNRQFTRGID